MTEQIRSFASFANACVIDKKGNHKYPVPITITSSHNYYAPMELGVAAIFCGKCHLCGRFGHKAAA